MVSILFTEQLDRALRAVNELEFACVTINELEFACVTINEVPTFRGDPTAYGGVTESGDARDGPSYAVREMAHERVALHPA